MTLQSSTLKAVPILSQSGHSFRVLAVNCVLDRRSFRPTVIERRRFQRLNVTLVHKHPRPHCTLYKSRIVNRQLIMRFSTQRLNATLVLLFCVRCTYNALCSPLWFCRICNSHCRKSDKILHQKQTFFSGGNYKFPIFFSAKLQIRLNSVPSVASDHRSSDKFPTPAKLQIRLNSAFFSGGNYKFPIFSQPNCKFG